MRRERDLHSPTRNVANDVWVGISVVGIFLGISTGVFAHLLLEGNPEVAASKIPWTLGISCSLGYWTLCWGLRLKKAT